MEVCFDRTYRARYASSRPGCGDRFGSVVTLRLRALRMVVVTARGSFGRNLRFPDGLTVLRAPNSAGKSSSFNAVIYALGLEGMLNAGRGIPLPHAFTDYIEHAGERLDVLASDVFLEIENGAGERLTIQRSVKGERDTRLVTAWHGSALEGILTAPAGPAQHYYVRDPGATTSAVGFHTLLLSFVGWVLPSVSKFSGGDTRLYPETIFPLMFVEQKKGWGAIEGRFPTHFGIRDVARRATEFLLALEVSHLAARRAELKEQQQSLRARWSLAVRETETVSRPVGVLVRGLPAAPVPDWPPTVPPSIWLAREDTWVAVNDEIASLAARLEGLSNETVPTTGEAATGARESLAADEMTLAMVERRAREAAAALEAEHSQFDAINDRLRVLDEDLVRNKDARKLQSLGALENWSVSDGRCPTCDSVVGAALLSHTHAQPSMSVEDNVRFLEEQRKVFELTLYQGTLAVAARERQVSSMADEAGEIRSRIRALRSTLTADMRTPSLAAVEERVRLSFRLRALTDARLQLFEHIDAFVTLAEEWAVVAASIRDLPDDGPSLRDEKKLAALQASLVRQLSDYGLRSVEPSNITISRGTYRPEYIGFDLQFDLSASDTIRTIWAYRLALLEVARSFVTNHLGLLMLDEPRQQSTEPVGFRSFFVEASHAAAAGQQVIVATSEDPTLVTTLLADIPHTLIEISERLLVLSDS